jgi:hypothetical protein
VGNAGWLLSLKQRGLMLPSLLRSRFNIDPCGSAWVVRCRTCSAGWLFDRHTFGVGQVRYLIEHTQAHEAPLRTYDLVATILSGVQMYQDAAFVLDQLQALTVHMKHVAQTAAQRQLPGAVQWAEGELARLDFTAQLVKVLSDEPRPPAAGGAR